MATCQRCGDEYTPNIWGDLGGLVGTPRLCEECSPLWPIYFAAAKATGLAMGAVFGFFIDGTSVEQLLDMFNNGGTNEE